MLEPDLERIANSLSQEAQKFTYDYSLYFDGSMPIEYFISAVTNMSKRKLTAAPIGKEPPKKEGYHDTYAILYKDCQVGAIEFISPSPKVRRQDLIHAVEIALRNPDSRVYIDLGTHEIKSGTRINSYKKTRYYGIYLGQPFPKSYDILR